MTNLNKGNKTQTNKKYKKKLITKTIKLQNQQRHMIYEQLIINKQI